MSTRSGKTFESFHLEKKPENYYLDLRQFAAPPADVNNSIQTDTNFKGRISNRIELQAKLKKPGYKISAESDDKIIRSLIEEYGAEFFRELRGNFSVAAKVADNKAIIACDTVGTKPIYYCHLPAQNILYFSSDIKSLLAINEIPAALNQDYLIEQKVLGLFSSPLSCFEGIRFLAGGAWLSIEIIEQKMVVRENPYSELNLAPDYNLTAREIYDDLSEIFSNTLKTYLQNYEKIGLCLSGGSDSSFLSLFLKLKFGISPPCFTVADHKEFPDVFYARLIAKQVKSRHTEIFINWTDFINFLPTYIWLIEFPSHYSFSQIFLSQKMRQTVDYNVSGLGDNLPFGRFNKNASFFKSWLVNYNELIDEGIRPPRHLTDFLTSLYECLKDEDKFETIYFLRNIVRQSFQAGISNKIGSFFNMEYLFPFLSEELIKYSLTIPRNPDGEQFNKIHFYKKIILEDLASPISESYSTILERKKLAYPEAESGIINRFTKICELNLNDEYFNKHEYKPFFKNKKELLIFDLFYEIFVNQRGKSHTELNLEDFIKAKSGRLQLLT